MGDHVNEHEQNQANLSKVNGLRQDNSRKPQYIDDDFALSPTTTTSTSLPVKEDDTQSVDVPIPPDGGWGWMVVLGSFIIHVVADGMAYSFGVMVVYLLNEFDDAGREEMGLIGAVMVGLTMGVGKLVFFYLFIYLTSCYITRILFKLVLIPP